MSFYKKQVKHCMRGDYDEYRNIKYYTTFDVIDKDCMPEIGDKHGTEVLIAIDELEVDPDDQIKACEEDYRYFKLTYKETDPIDGADEEDLRSHEYVAYDDSIEEPESEEQHGFIIERPAIKKITEREVHIKVGGDVMVVPREQFELRRRHRGFLIASETMDHNKLKKYFCYC